ncbi:DKNYY domain-containing protein [Psychrobium sp. 1_MG-2023]|uniref:DKNYY domain-containing protein n=1 Tax=Psychrobium sp. 1_MG-2023 TaxID=3062624 RepID=UPI000C3321D3|nr:DKNYY domain-containing protein [Psychrobium sp. 1_MG-2023]MDP2561887.1 DKNYY domain-containing protein [Psychrobium sp. 1_MG-2023]PKF59697.1 hypothetical protein CW748_00395 [Alteromonadales bacterium alter-6D02]
MKKFVPILLVSLLAGCKTTAPLNGYAIDKEHNRILFGKGVGFLNQKVVSKPLVNADFASFESINHLGYAKDKNFVYYHGKTVAFADPTTFEHLDGKYYADKNHVYLNARVVKGASPQDIKLLEVSDWSWDNNYALSQGKVIINHGAKNFTPCAIDSFRVLGDEQFSKDKHCVFYNGIKIEGADAKSFRTKSRSYAYDKNNAYYKSEKITGINHKQLKVLRLDYARDKQHVFYQGKLINNANVKDFRVIPLNSDFAKDNVHAYFKGQVIKGAKPKELKVTFLSDFSQNKTQCFLKTEPADCQTKKTLATNQTEQNSSPNTSILDGIDLSRVNSPTQRTAAIGKAVDNIFKINSQQLSHYNDKLEEIFTKRKEELEGQYLTPKKASNIDLRQLPSSYNFYLMSAATPRKVIHYEFKGIEGETAKFALHSSRVLGAMFEHRTLNGKVLKRSEQVLTTAINYHFSPFECMTDLGGCSHTKQSEKSTTSVVRTAEFNIEYQDGLWLKTSANYPDKQDVYLFDNYGFVVVHAIKIKGKLSKLWLRFNDNQESKKDS